jgi:hypothetical protein
VAGFCKCSDESSCSSYSTYITLRIRFYYICSFSLDATVLYIYCFNSFKASVCVCGVESIYIN